MAERGYAQEFLEAFERTRSLGLPVSPDQLLVQNDCVNRDVVMPLLQNYLGQLRAEEAVGQAFAINVNLIPCLYEQTGIPFTLTLGWFEHMGRDLYRHSEQLLKLLLRDGFASVQSEGLPLHV